MSSFSLDFPDVEVFSLLGDDILVDDVLVKGEFRKMYNEDELLDRVDSIHPTVEVMREDEHLFTRDSTVLFNGEQFGVLRTMPQDEQTSLIVLRRPIL